MIRSRFEEENVKEDSI